MFRGKGKFHIEQESATVISLPITRFNYSIPAVKM